MPVYRPQERRLVLRLMAYWDDLRGARDFPRCDEIDPETIGDDWPACCLLRLADPHTSSTLLYAGPDVLPDGLPRDQTTVADLPPEVLLPHALSFLEQALAKQVPISLGGEVALPSGTLLYRSILLPLSDDGRRIDHLLGAANWRPVAADADPATPDAQRTPA
jgi:hypothetical protein